MVLFKIGMVLCPVPWQLSIPSFSSSPGETGEASLGAIRMAHLIDESCKRSATDTCVYVTRPGQSTRKMISVKPGESWQTFLNNASAKLGVQVGAVFNSHDEIKRVADLVQGDILFVKVVADEDSPSSPHSLQGSRARMLCWLRFSRLALLQCVDGYILTDAISRNKYCETLKGRRISDDMPVIIKRFASRPGRSVNTLKTCLPLCWSLRHPHYAHNVDILFTNDMRRALGGSGGMKRAKREGGCQVMSIVLQRYETSLSEVVADHIKLQKPIETEKIVAWITQLLKVLKYMHNEMRVAHRNLKLSNVLIDNEGNAKLSDVALPKVDPGATAYHMRVSCIQCCAIKKGQLAPHMEHISPEAFQSGCTSEKDDIWALGCILTELVTQKLVSERAPGETFGKSQGAVAQAVAEVTIKDTTLGKLCRNLLEIDPAKRPSAAETLWKHMKGFATVHSLDRPPLTKAEMSNVSSMGKSNDLPTLISAILKDGAFQAAEAAAARLHEILFYEAGKRICMKDTYATPFGRMSGMAALCYCVTKGSPLAQQRAASAIRNALLDDAIEQYTGVEQIRALVASVVMGTPHTQGNAAAALANVCATRRKARDDLNSVGGMGALAALIASCTGRSMTSVSLLNSPMLEAASAVRNACIGHAANRDDLMRSKGVASFVHVLACQAHAPASLREKQSIMYEQVAGALRNACNQHTGNCMQLSQAEGILAVVPLLSTATVNVQVEVVGLIRNACVGYFGNKDHMTYAGGFWSMAQMLNNTNLSEAVTEEIVSAVHYATVGHQINKQAAGEAGLVRALVALLHPGPSEGSMRAKQEVAACLRLVCDESESNSAELVKCSGVPGLFELMEKGPKEAKEEAVAAIAVACCAYAPNLDYVSEKHRAELQDVMASPAFGDESKLFAKSILLSWTHSRQRNSRSLKQIDSHDGEGLHETRSWCPGRTLTGADGGSSVSLADSSKKSLGSAASPARDLGYTQRLPHLSRRPRPNSRSSKVAPPQQRDSAASWRWPENQKGRTQPGMDKTTAILAADTMIASPTVISPLGRADGRA